MASRPIVAHFKDHFLPASETFIYHLLQGMRRYDSIIIDRYCQQNRQQFPMTNHFSPAEFAGRWYAAVERGLLRYTGFSPYLETVLRRKGAALVHAHFGQLGALIRPVCRRYGLPLVVSFYGKDLAVFTGQPSWERRFQPLWHEAACILTLGPNMAERLVQLGCPSEKITIVPLAIDVEAFSFVERMPPAPGHAIRLLSVARLVPKKGLDLLLRAMVTLVAKHRVHLNIAGDGPQRALLEMLVHDLGLERHVTLLGWLDNQAVAEEMRRAHLFVLPSRRDPETGDMEGTPTVLLEAQARGLPVISTLHADIPSIVREEFGGWLAQEGDEGSLVRKLEEALSQQDQWAARSRAARAFVAQRHHREDVAQQVEQIYDQCLAA